MPTGLIEQQHGVRAGIKVFGDFSPMQVLCIGVAFGGTKAAQRYPGHDCAETRAIPDAAAPVAWACI